MQLNEPIEDDKASETSSSKRRRVLVKDTKPDEELLVLKALPSSIVDNPSHYWKAMGCVSALGTFHLGGFKVELN